MAACGPPAPGSPRAGKSPRGPGRAPAAGIVLLLVGLLLVAGFAGAQADATAPGREPVSLALDPGLHLDNGTYLVGKIGFVQDLIRDPGVVGTTGMTTPGGAVVVCPVEHGAQGIIPTLARLDTDCPEGQRHEDPRLAFGSRTWLQFQGNYRSEPSGKASVSVLFPNGAEEGALWMNTPADDGLDLRFGVEGLRFSPAAGSSRVMVMDQGETYHYNGTDWAFVFERAGTVKVFGDGFQATRSDSLAFSLGQGDLEDVAAATRPRVFLDLQELVAGPDAREAVGNTTRHFSVGLVPHFQNGALLGNLNGTVGAVELDGQNGTLVRGSGFDLALNGTMLEGDGEIRFVLHDRSLWVGGTERQSIPWFVVALLWSLAAASWLVGLPWRRSPAWQVWVERALPVLAFVVWDRLVAGLLGVSALPVLFSSDPLAWGLRLVTLQLAGLVLGWLAFYVPGRTILRRVLPARLRFFAPGVAFPLFLLLMFLMPGLLITLAGLVANF